MWKLATLNNMYQFALQISAVHIKRKDNGGYDRCFDLMMRITNKFLKEAGANV